MDAPKWPRLRGLMSWITNWRNKPKPDIECAEKVGDKKCCIIKKLKAYSFDRENVEIEYDTTSPLHLAAINYDNQLVDKLLRDSEDVTTDLMQVDNLGNTAFYYVMKNCPASIEKLLFKCINFGNKHKNYEIEITFSTISKKDENTFFEEICKMKTDPSLREAFERIFLHPTTEAYFFERWSQIKYAYYVIPLFFHFVYSIVYSTYAILVYRVICGASILPLENNNLNKTKIKTLEYAKTLERNCTIDYYQDVQQNEDPLNYGMIALVCWILLLFFTALMIMQETCKFLHYRSENNKKRYFWSLETLGYVLCIVSVVLISFHQDPFGSVVILQPYQYHTAAIGVFATWFVQMLLMRRIPKVGMFIEMIWPVSATFFQFFVGYGYLIASFACSFYILFPDKYAFKNGLPAAFVKVIAMMLGEIDYNEMFYSNDELYDIQQFEYQGKIYSGKLKTVLKPPLFPFTAQFFVTMFILFVSIVIVNFLFGLAVYDVQKLYNTAEKDMLLGQIQIVRRNEKIIKAFGPPLLRKLFRDKMIPSCTGRKYQEKFYIVKLRRNTSDELERKIYDKCISLKQQNEVNDKKGWGVIRNEVTIDRYEKKLNQIIDEMKQEMMRQKQEMEDQRKSEIEEIKGILQEMMREKHEMEDQRKSEIGEIKGVLQEMQRCVSKSNNVNSNTA